MLALNTRVELKTSFEWIKSAFQVFRIAPIQFIVLTIFSILVSITPILGAFLSPILTARFAYLASEIEANREVRFSTILNNLFSNKSVLTIAMISVAISSILFLLQYFLGPKSSGVEMMVSDPISLMLFLIPAILVQMALWLSPIICQNHANITPVDAMILSFKACLYNAATLLIYGLLVVGFTLLSILPVGLGLFIWLPILNITSYFIYKSMYTPRL